MLKRHILPQVYCRCFPGQRFTGEDTALVARTVTVTACAQPRLQNWGEGSLVSKHCNLLLREDERQHPPAVPVASSELVGLKGFATARHHLSSLPGASVGDELRAGTTMPRLSPSSSSLAGSAPVVSHLGSTCSQPANDLCFIALFLSNLILDLTCFPQNLILRHPPEPPASGRLPAGRVGRLSEQARGHGKPVIRVKLCLANFSHDVLHWSFSGLCCVVVPREQPSTACH